MMALELQLGTVGLVDVLGKAVEAGSVAGAELENALSGRLNALIQTDSADLILQNRFEQILVDASREGATIDARSSGESDDLVIVPAARTNCSAALGRICCSAAKAMTS